MVFKKKKNIDEEVPQYQAETPRIKSQEKPQVVWEVEDEIIESREVLKNNRTGEYYSAPQAFALILNLLEDLRE